MSDYDYDLIVLGSGPGGYVAAIRGAQLGLKTAIVERENLGGVCLNWGCIPTKALIHNADVLETLREATKLGFSFDNLTVDYSAAVKRSRSVAERQTKGVAFLMRKNKIDVIEGHGVFTDAHTVKVSPSEINPDARRAHGHVRRTSSSRSAHAHAACPAQTSTASRSSSTATPSSWKNCRRSSSSWAPAPSAWSSPTSTIPTAST